MSAPGWPWTAGVSAPDLRDGATGATLLSKGKSSCPTLLAR
jgi:hypothetical protein